MPILKIPASFGTGKYGYSYYGVIEVYPTVYEPKEGVYTDFGAGVYTKMSHPYSERGGRVE